MLLSRAIGMTKSKEDGENSKGRGRGCGHGHNWRNDSQTKEGNDKP